MCMKLKKVKEKKPDCIFCQIINSSLPTTLAYADEKVVAFNDLHPKTPTHILMVPSQHIATLNDINSDYYFIIGYMANVMVKLAKQWGHADKVIV